MKRILINLVLYSIMLALTLTACAWIGQPRLVMKPEATARVDELLTQMTRDGTFLIENGQVTRPAQQLRFTQSYVDALNAVEAISRETQLVPGALSGGRMAYRVPALRIGQFTFTSATQFQV